MRCAVESTVSDIVQGKEVITMWKRLLFSAIAAGLLMSSVAAAADVSGKWKAEFTTPDGTARVNTFTFKAEGAALTGTVAGSQDETAIQNGKINGEDISFSAERPFGTFKYQGKVGGNEIKLKVDFNGQTFEMIAKRVTG
jgi:hypothetical protein